jgi:hypothetical protein
VFLCALVFRHFHENSVAALRVTMSF